MSDVSLALEKSSLGGHLKFISILSIHVKGQWLTTSAVKETASFAKFDFVVLSVVRRKQVIDGLIDHISQQDILEMTDCCQLKYSPTGQSSDKYLHFSIDSTWLAC